MKKLFAIATLITGTLMMVSCGDDGTLTAANKGLWGGLVVPGNAPISEETIPAQIEDVPADDTHGLYGGTDASDNSGTIQYLSIRHGGAVIDAADECMRFSPNLSIH